MIAANTATAELPRGRAACRRSRRVVRAPERWPRIVETGRRSLGEQLPAGARPARALRLPGGDAARPRPASLRRSLALDREAARPGRVRGRSAGPSTRRATSASPSQDYAHSTAPNRRFPDLVTQRLPQGRTARRASALHREELEAIAAHCTDGDGPRKVERRMRKVAAAVMLGDHIGETFDAVVTGVKPKGLSRACCTRPPRHGRAARARPARRPTHTRQAALDRPRARLHRLRARLSAPRA